MNQVEEAVKMWESFRKGTISELELIPEDKWEYRPAEGARTVRALARHIAQSGAGFTEQLLKDGGSFPQLFDPKFREEFNAMLPQANAKEEIIDMLRTLGADSVRPPRRRPGAGHENDPHLQRRADPAHRTLARGQPRAVSPRPDRLVRAAARDYPGADPAGPGADRTPYISLKLSRMDGRDHVRGSPTA